MKALTINNPWAWALINGIVDIVSRRSPTKYRGEILIYASGYYDYDRIEEKIFLANDIEIPRLLDLEFGAIIGRANLTDCVRWNSSQWFQGPWAYILKNPIPFENPIKYPGKTKWGIFTIKNENLLDLDQR